LDRFGQGAEEFEIFELDYSDFCWAEVLQILELYSSWFHAPVEPSADRILSRITQRFYRVLYVMHKTGVVVSCAFIVEHPQTGVYHLDYLCVRPGMCGGGLGSRFFKSIVKILSAESKYDLLTLESDRSLIPWYLKLGCLNLDVESDREGDFKWYLLVHPLGYNSLPASPRTILGTSHEVEHLQVAEMLQLIHDIKEKLCSDIAGLNREEG